MNLKCRLCKCKYLDNFYNFEFIPVDYIKCFKKINLMECKDCGFCFNSFIVLLTNLFLSSTILLTLNFGNRICL